MEADRLRYSKVKGVVLDTNMLLVPYQFRVDVLEEIQRLLPGVKVFVISSVLQELEKIEKEGSLNERLAARIGKQIAEKLPVLETSGPADAALLELSRQGYVIATNDRALRKRIRDLGGLTIYLRERNHLEIG